MNKYQKARAIIDWLEKNEFDGDLYVKFFGGLHLKDEEVTSVPAPKPSVVYVAPQKAAKVKLVISPQQMIRVEDVEWARSPGWTKKMIKFLLDSGISEVSTLEGNTIGNLRTEGFSNARIDMIREGLGTINKHLLGDVITKRK